VRIAVFDEFRIGVVGDGVIHDVSSALPGWVPNSPWLVNRFIGQFDSLRPKIDGLIRAGNGRPVGEVALRAPVPRPTNLFAAPLNFRDHRAEMTGPITSGAGTAEELGFFLKAVGSISGPADPVLLPNRPERRFDFEGEVAFVIGRRACAVSDSEALDHVFGYTILLDMTMRMTATEREERTMRKSFATFAPLGPWVVTVDEAGPPEDLSLRVWRNGELCQDAKLADLIVSVPQLLARASHVLPLEPGDVYSTGSPAGVGQILVGDVIEAESPRIGRLRVEVVARDW
jgi:2-keto-4-pentenoate hydratase/2-oxohepta-3-ene-1,7-dioic acid hydratase in catechol pathway